MDVPCCFQLFLHWGRTYELNVLRIQMPALQVGMVLCGLRLYVNQSINRRRDVQMGDLKGSGRGF